MTIEELRENSHRPLIVDFNGYQTPTIIEVLDDTLNFVWPVSKQGTWEDVRTAPITEEMAEKIFLRGPNLIANFSLESEGHKIVL